MEANVRGDIHQFFTTESSRGRNQKTREWESNDWKWNGESCTAVPVNPRSLDYRNKQPCHDVVVLNSSSTGPDEFNFIIHENGLSEANKRRRILATGNSEQCDDFGSYTLKLGDHEYPVREENLDNGGMKNGKRAARNLKHPKCQVDGCGADLSQSKGYHRRHKACEEHAKATSVVIENAIQRFCQQCSRFHLLQEFDGEKKSCRQRLDDHNEKRRKRHFVASHGRSSAVDTYKFHQPKDNENVPNLFKTVVASLVSSSVDLLKASHDLQKVGTSVGISREAVDVLLSGMAPLKEYLKQCSLAKTKCPPAMAPREMHCQEEALCLMQHMLPAACTVEREKTRGFDLNVAYVEEQDGNLGCEEPAKQATVATGSYDCPPRVVKDCHRSNPPQIRVNTDSTSTRSPSSSNGNGQSRTDRIVLKLFRKDLNDLPLDVREQIFAWLSNIPTNMEAYIRSGCIILTVYLRLSSSAWDELCHDLGASLNRLLRLSADHFWQVGWIYARLQHHVAFISDGKVVWNGSFGMEGTSFSKILSVTPIAAPPSSRVTFLVRGSNLVRSTTRLLCAFEGRYLTQETDQPSADCSNNETSHEQFQSLSFSCYLSDAIGRGFIEVEDDCLSNAFFPFIVAEEDVCAEIRTLESSMDAASCDEAMEERLEEGRSLGVNFLHEMGWLLRRSQLRVRSESDSPCSETFSLARFRWILRFSMDRDWSALVKKLLDILFDGIIDLGGIPPAQIASSENLLHYAVQRNSELTVKLLLRYRACKGSDEYLFRPDMTGPSNITPLHVAATSICAEGMLDLLTDDPGQFGVKAWKNARDGAGFTPEDCALARGHESSIALMQKKINKMAAKFDVAVNMPSKQSEKPFSLEINKSKPKPSQPPSCKLCERPMAYRSSAGRSSVVYRPVLLSMVGIAAVCVCVALLFKGPPEVLFVDSPFRWELLEYGYM